MVVKDSGRVFDQRNRSDSGMEIGGPWSSSGVKTGCMEQLRHEDEVHRASVRLEGDRGAQSFCEARRELMP